MDSKATLAPLLAALGDLVSWLAQAKVRGVIIGGVAASLLGRPRLTRDIDAIVIVPDREWGRFMNVGATFGFLPRRSDALEFAAITRVLLLRHEPSAIDIDISFGLLPFEEETVARAAMTSIGTLRVPVATAEDLIVMKAVAGRPRDIGDIEGLVAASPKLDRRRIRRLTRAFAAEMDMPEIVSRLEPLLPSTRAPAARGRPARRGHAKSSTALRPARAKRGK